MRCVFYIEAHHNRLYTIYKNNSCVNIKSWVRHHIPGSFRACGCRWLVDKKSPTGYMAVGYPRTQDTPHPVDSKGVKGFPAKKCYATTTHRLLQTFADKNRKSYLFADGGYILVGYGRRT